MYRDHLDRALSEGLRSGDELPAGEGLLRMGPLKVLIDGSLNTRTAYCADPYPGHESRGTLTVDPGELDALLARAADGGIRATVHAIGDAAATVALDALGRIGGGRIEHAQLVADADLPRFAALRVEAGVQPAHALDDRDVAEHYWPGRTGRAFALRSLLDSGASVVFGSDAPVAPLDPWVAVSAAVARARPGRSRGTRNSGSASKRRSCPPRGCAVSARGPAIPPTWSCSTVIRSAPMRRACARCRSPRPCWRDASPTETDGASSSCPAGSELSPRATHQRRGWPLTAPGTS